MDFKQLEYFVRVAEHGSFSRAAAALDTGQPFLSRQVRQLEVELRKNLFHRHGRGIVLTDAGEQFLAFAKSVLQQYEAASQALSKAEADITGRVVVGLPPSLGRVLTVPLVRAFSARFPQARLTIVEALSTSLHERLVADKIDATLVYDPVASSLTQVERLVTEPMCLILRKSPENAGLSTVSFSQLADHSLIFPCEPHPLRSRVDAEASRQGFELDVAFEIDGVASIEALVGNGLGAAVVPYNVLRAGLHASQHADELLICPLVDPIMSSSICLVTASRRPPTLLATKMVDMLRQVALDTLVLPDDAREAWLNEAKRS
ncbi:LysR family transcriptional regulator [Pigmentiphaga litoralis]|uniref:LysR family transcriptional regulator n=1 Tax=Pigmentiphaga litoralis TaxID=516702 RepID=UPI001676D78D|nr:LysR family transcriptional regulator [Pigmentiphaga litoralis]GGX06975.1 LysR family transcriptional regulator [Pigmentiphaga litoralis]